MDFAQPVSFKNADIGHCAHLKPREDEEGAEIIQPEPVPTPGFPTSIPVLVHVSGYLPLVSNVTLHF